MKKNTFQDKLIESFASHQDRTAVEYGPLSLTYAQLDRRSDYIAQWLFHQGHKTGTLLGILTENRLDLITAIIGILKTGCIFVPMDPANPDGRLEVMIRVTGLKYILVDAANRQRIEDKVPGLSCILFDDVFLQGEDSWYLTPPPILYKADDQLYIYFTSGSSGTPKAIIGKNKSLRHFILWEIETFSITRGNRVSQLITPTFDPFLRDVFVPLLAGGVLCIPVDRNIILDAEALIHWVDTHEINLMHGVPSFFRLFASHPLLDDKVFKSLKYVLLSGEKIKPPDLAHWYDVYGDRIPVVNLYGPTETTLVKTYYFIHKADLNKKNISIGKAMRGAQIVILDDNSEVCEQLVTGEIHIRTPFRSDGYLNDPELTCQRFTPNPFSNDPGDFLYKTGDLGRMLEDGNIELIGRKDRQVKIRGFRIEPEEIESLLAAHTAVFDAVVVKNELPDGNEWLAAYIMISPYHERKPGEETGLPPQGELLVEDLRKYLARLLPEYMVPTYIMILESIPRKINGKVDYEMLPDALQALRVDIIPPATPCEAQLLSIWEKILGTAKISVESKFYDLGGHSLNVMALISQIHKTFDVKISLADIFTNPTIRKQAGLIEGTAKERFAAVEPVEKKDYYPVSSAQGRIYLIQQLNPESTVYNMMRSPTNIKGHIDTDTLRQTIEQVIKRHESLRTSFEMIDGIPFQRIHETVEFDIEVDDAAASNRKAAKLVQDFLRPFDLSQAPLLRVGLIKTAPDHHLLLIDMHHIISDGTSMSVLMQDYTRLNLGESLLPLKIQYKDFTCWQDSQEKHENMTAQQNHWLKRFESGIPASTIPTDYPRLTRQSFKGGVVELKLGKEQTQALSRIPLEEGVTLNMVLFAITNVLLGKLSHQQDIVVGVPVAGRRHADLEKVIGMFVNTLPMRNFPEDHKPFSTFLEEVKTRMLQDFDNQDYPFDRMVERLLQERDPAHNPLFDVFFTFSIEDREGQSSESTPGEASPQDEYNITPSLVDLSLEAIRTGDYLLLHLEYCSDLYKEETAAAFLAHYASIVHQVIKNKDIQIKHIELVEEQEKYAIQTAIQEDMQEIAAEFDVELSQP